VYAISRSNESEGGGATGHDGRPVGIISGKYAKPAHTKGYVDEPVYGLKTVESGEPILVIEGIADAITAHECGYAYIPPVMTKFKNRDRKHLLDILEDHDVKLVYVVQGAERPTSDVDKKERLTVEQFGPDVEDAVATVDYLVDHDLGAGAAELPRPGIEKGDLDDYFGTWSQDLSPVMSTAKPPADHPAHDPQETAVRTAWENQTTVAPVGRPSALFDLDITDVTGLSWGYQGLTPWDTTARTRTTSSSPRVRTPHTTTSTSPRTARSRASSAKLAFEHLRHRTDRSTATSCSPRGDT
jgi:hypothetical protein